MCNPQCADIQNTSRDCRDIRHLAEFYLRGWKPRVPSKCSLLPLKIVRNCKKRTSSFTHADTSYSVAAVVMYGLLFCDKRFIPLKASGFIRDIRHLAESNYEDGSLVSQRSAPFNLRKWSETVTKKGVLQGRKNVFFSPKLFWNKMNFW